MPANEAVKGLRLTLPGAPSAPHTVRGIPGWYAPHVPTPVGGPGDLSLEVAKKIAADPTVDLELVDIPAKEVEGVRSFWAEHRREARAGLIDAARSGAAVAGRGDSVVEADATRVREEAASVAGKES